jgi:hypothetical protein
MPHVQWNELSPGGKRLEEIRYELGYLDRKEFAKRLQIHPTDYCRILRDDRLTIPRLEKIFTTLIRIGYYKHFEAFDDSCVYFPFQKTGIIRVLQVEYDMWRNRQNPKY